MHRTRQSAPRPVRTSALAAAALLIAAGAATACGQDSMDKNPGAASPAAPPPAAVAKPASTPTYPPLPDSLTAQRLTWERCPAATTLQGADAGVPKPLSDGTVWECATLKAPRDYAHPDGDTIKLALIRAKARPGAGQKRLGSLIFNFGGPGASGVATLPQAVGDYGGLHPYYDLVSFDPRGIGASTPAVRCLDDKATDASYKVDSSPDNDAELKAADDLSHKFVAACERNSGKILRYVGTTNAARDMDLLRQVLGDDKINYFGISYGTELGGVYAHLFPKKVGRAVFDGVVDPTQEEVKSSLAQSKGFELALDNYLKDCAKKAACPTGHSVKESRKKIIALLKQLDAHPLPTNDGRGLNQGEAQNGIAAALYSKDLWTYLTQAFDETERQRTGNIMLALADTLSGRDTHGHYSNLQPANTAVNCADNNQRFTDDDVKAKLNTFRKASPIFGEFAAWDLTACTGWPVKGLAKTPDVSADGSAPIVVVGNTGDPATPYAGARRMAQELGKGVAVELTYKGQGHGAYGSGACVTKTVNHYLIEGKVPKNGTVCS